MTTFAADGDEAGLEQLRHCFDPPDSKPARRALLAAARGAQPDTVSLLLGWGVSPDTRDGRGLSAGFYAITPAEDGGSDAADRRLMVLRELADAGLNLDARGKGDYSLLQAVASSGYVEVILFLLSRGADIDHQDSTGQTALMAAVLARDLDAVRALLGGGASPNLEDKDHQTALSLAQAAGATDIATAIEQVLRK